MLSTVFTAGAKADIGTFMASLLGRCGRCGGEVTLTVGQSFGQSNGLRWHMATCCPFCGLALEIERTERSPQNIRLAMLAQEGEWRLVAHSVPTAMTCVAKVLRRELRFSLAEAMTLIHGMPGVVASGTIAEMQWLAHLIRNECQCETAVVRAE